MRGDPRGDVPLSAMGRYLLVVLGLFACGAPSARAEDLERGKSGPAIFAADCSACHRSAQGLAFGMSATDLMDLLRQHYTTGPGPANQVANYLLSVVATARRPKKKPLTEPQSTAAGEQAGKRRPRGEEPTTDPVAGQRPPGEIRSNEAAVGEQGGAAPDHGRPGPASKRRQQADHPAETLPNRAKKLGQPTTATRGPEAEPAQPPEPVPGPSPSVAARPSEPAEVRQLGESGQPKPAEGGKAETGRTQATMPGEAAKPTPRQDAGDQPAFSAPSP